MVIVAPHCMMMIAALAHARQPCGLAFSAVRRRRPATPNGRVDHQGNRHQAAKNCLHSFATIPVRIITLIGGIVKRTSGKGGINVKFATLLVHMVSRRNTFAEPQRALSHLPSCTDNSSCRPSSIQSDILSYDAAQFATRNGLPDRQTNARCDRRSLPRRLP